MKYHFNIIIPALLCVLMACSNNQKAAVGKPKTALVFPQGKKVTNNSFTGTVYLHNMIEGDSLNQNSVGNVTFEAKARSKWHVHPAGQILLATDGVGYYQEQGKPKLILRKGDVIKCPPNVAHWHGASIDTAFVQIAITSREKGPTLWLEPVTDAQYKGN